MDFITTAIIANSAYDIFKSGLKLSGETLKERLGQWLKEALITESVAAELTKLGLNDEMSELAITRRIEQSPEIASLIRNINADVAVVAESTITSVTQNHSGSGDNVAGNKIVQ